MAADYTANDLEELREAIAAGELQTIEQKLELGRALYTVPHLGTELIAMPLGCGMDYVDVGLYRAVGQAAWGEEVRRGRTVVSLPTDLRSLAALAPLSVKQLEELDRRVLLGELCPSEISMEVRELLAAEAGESWSPCADCGLKQEVARVVRRVKGILDHALSFMAGGPSRDLLLGSVLRAVSNLHEGRGPDASGAAGGEPDSCLPEARVGGEPAKS